MVSIIKNKLSEKRAGLARAESLNKNQSGVTIVELMIVVAVAALIIVLVLVAAPALQRNARNGQRRTDIGAIRGQLTTVQNNNNGTLPAHTAAGIFDTDVLEQIEQGIYKVDVAPVAFGTTNAEDTVYYVGGSGTVPAITVPLPDPVSLHIITGVECANNIWDGGNASVGDIAALYAVPVIASTTVTAASKLHLASNRTFVIVYQLEGETTARCEDNA